VSEGGRGPFVKRGLFLNGTAKVRNISGTKWLVGGGEAMVFLVIKGIRPVSKQPKKRGGGWRRRKDYNKGRRR